MTVEAGMDSTSSTSSDFLDKLKKALSRDGDFPASARVVSELREVISKPESTTNQVAEIILREPSLGTRVLHLVNSSFYRRAKPIMTVSQAVIQIGMRPLAELCSSLVLLQKFIPVARKSGPFAQCLKKTITTSLLTSTLSAEMQKQEKSSSSGVSATLKDETGYLSGTFAEMGILLLAYYFPKLYESAQRRAEQKKLSLAQSIQELVGLSPIEISIEVLEELQLPEEYKRVLAESAEIANAPVTVNGSADSADDSANEMAFALYAGSTLSQAINEGHSADAISEAIREINAKIPVETELLGDVLGKLVDAYRDYCSSLELQLPGLPEELQHYKAKATESNGGSTDAGDETLSQEEQFLDFVEEIRLAVENREPSASVITTVMETFAWSLGFDRVFLMLFGRGKQTLNGRMLLGHIPDFDPKSFTRSINSDGAAYAPDMVALKESRPVYRGDPIFPDGWPFAVIPVGFEKRAVGVIYADRTGENEGKELSSREEAAIGVLAELLDRSISLNS